MSMHLPDGTFVDDCIFVPEDPFEAERVLHVEPEPYDPPEPKETSSRWNESSESWEPY